MKLLLMLPLLLASCYTPVLQTEGKIPMQQGSEQLRRESPNSSWESSYFELINERAKVANLSNLRSAVLPSDDLEVRMWIGFGLSPLKGIIIKRHNGQWSGMHLEPINPRFPNGNYQQALRSPKSGWDNLWRRLVDEGILTLPDSSQLGNEVVFPDGKSYVVEMNTGNTYRTYRYRSPEYQSWTEAKRMLNIVSILKDEFDIAV